MESNRKKFNVNELISTASTRRPSNFTDISFTSGSTKVTHGDEQYLNPLTKKPFSNKYYEILQKRKLLPAYDAKKKLHKLVNENQIIILQGETGSGKTTQVPQFLIELLPR
jgi:HrpA-like RNA helicase